MAKRNSQQTTVNVFLSFLTPNDSNITTTPPPLLPSLPDDFDLFDTTSDTKTLLAPRFTSSHEMEHGHDVKKRSGNRSSGHNDEDNDDNIKHKENYFSSSMIASAPMMPMTDTIYSKNPRITMHATSDHVLERILE